MSNYPSTARFFVKPDPSRRLNDPILDIWYQPTPDSTPARFAHCWEVHGWGPEYDGTWEFNRDRVALDHQYWDRESGPGYADLPALLAHLEATFQEGVPHCRPD